MQPTSVTWATGSLAGMKQARSVKVLVAPSCRGLSCTVTSDEGNGAMPGPIDSRAPFVRYTDEPARSDAIPAIQVGIDTSGDTVAAPKSIVSTPDGKMT